MSRYQRSLTTTLRATIGGECVCCGEGSLSCVVRVNKLRTALNYLKKAQQIEMRHEGSAANPAGTSLNLCAVLSQLERYERPASFPSSILWTEETNRHEEALLHARSAVYLIKEELRSVRSWLT